ncbi:phosphomannose isomerase type II C-terminal cupin domain [Candidatus Omnitrophota bacterium]
MGNYKECEIGASVSRPWGAYTVLGEGNRFKIKLVVVEPNKRLSLQRHKERSEHWVVVEGEAKITNGNKSYFLKPNESAYIPKGELHRIVNEKQTKLKIVEVQCGDYLEEDDIIRYADDFGREEK